MDFKILRENPSLFILLLMGAFGVMGGGLLAPGLPALMEPFEVGAHQVGLVLSTYTLAAALSLPFTGLFIDVYGRRRVGLFCLAVDGLFGVLAPLSFNFSVLLVVRFIQGIGIAGLIPVAMSIIGDLYSGRQRLNLIGMLSGSISLGAVVIPFLGGLLATLNWRFPFWVYGLSLVLGLYFYGYIPETSRPSGQLHLEKFKDHFQSLGRALKFSRLRSVFYNAILLFFFLYCLVNFLPILLDVSHGLDEWVAGLFLAISASLSALVATQAVIIDETFKNKIAPGFLLFSLGLISIPIWPAAELISISVLLTGTGIGFIQPTIYNRATKLAPEELSGGVIAVFNSMKFVGMTASPVLLGVVFRYTNPAGPFIATGIIGVIWASWDFYGKDSTGREVNIDPNPGN